MRGPITRAVAVCLMACGCSSPRPVATAPPPAPPVVQPTPPDTGFAAVVPASAVGPAEPTRTLAYWNSIREIAERKPASDLKTSLKEYKKAAAEIRKLPAVGVDGELLAAAENVARGLDRFAELGGFVTENARQARQMGIERTVYEVGTRANEATSQLRGLRAKLSSRYGTEFPPIEEPTR